MNFKEKIGYTEIKVSKVAGKTIKHSYAGRRALIFRAINIVIRSETHFEN